jgi:hypothetical protein
MDSAAGDGSGVPPHRGSPTRHYPVERFDSLLRALVSLELVSLGQDDKADGWQLTPDAQRRVAELARSQAQLPEDVIHVWWTLFAVPLPA